MQLNLVVLRAENPCLLADFYRLMGLSFMTERHGRGVEHMACDTGMGVFEIYPRTKDEEHTRSVRLGFAVNDLDACCDAALRGKGALLSHPRATPWGRRATIRDPEGHTIDLLEA